MTICGRVRSLHRSHSSTTHVFATGTLVIYYETQGQNRHHHRREGHRARLGRVSPCRRDLRPDHPCRWRAATAQLYGAGQIMIRKARPEDLPAITQVRISVTENHLSVEQMAERGITPESVIAEMAA